MFCFVPVQTWFFKRDRLKHGHSRPEARFLTSLVVVWLFPVSLLWFAFTDYGNVSYWSPIIAGTVLGFCDPLLWLSMLNYITGKIPLFLTCFNNHLISSPFEIKNKKYFFHFIWNIKKLTKQTNRLLPQRRRLRHRRFPHPLLRNRRSPLPSRRPHVRQYVCRMGLCHHRIPLVRSRRLDLHNLFLWRQDTIEIEACPKILGLCLLYIDTPRVG